MPQSEHLQMIQTIIERMGRNSFLLKGWTVGLVAALIGLSAEKSNADFAIIAASVSLVFGLLDAYYLAVERRYRALYERVIDPDERVPDWSLNAGKVGLGDLRRAVISPTVFPLHGSVIACAVTVALAA
jgi:hypothetical protein